METCLEWLGGIRRARALEDVHPVVCVVPVVHGDVDVELAVDLVELGCPNVALTRGRAVHLHTLRWPRPADI
jgi:hypothetical protein